MPLSSACLFLLAQGAATPMTIGAVPLDQLAGRGASVDFAEYEAESGCYQGALIGPSRRLSDLAAEASGRRAVRLERPGDYVEFTLGREANAVSLRYALPDSADGRGLDSTLTVEAGGKRIGSIELTSRFSWYYGRYPFTNRPADGAPRHFFDEARLWLGTTLRKGTRVRLSLPAGAPWTVVDLADFEAVPPPLAKPAHAIALSEFGADPSGHRDSYTALATAIHEARRRRVPLWLGKGRFRIDRHVTVHRVTILGAGPWHTTLFGSGIGLYGRKAPHGSTAVRLSDFAIVGAVDERDDRAQLAGIGGSIGGGSLLSNLWLQHHKTGIWLDGPLGGLTVRKLRITDMTADGINLRGGAANAEIEHVFVRNSGDDGIALWSKRLADHDIAIRNNTVVAPNLANGIAVYGGRDIAITSNFVADTLTEGGGIHLGNRFSAVPLSGRIRVEDNLLMRSGSFDPNWKSGVGALWLYALDDSIDADIRIGRAEIVDSTIEAVQLRGKPIRTVAFDRLAIRGAHRWLQIESGGEARFERVRAEQLAVDGYWLCNAAFSLRGSLPAGPVDRRCEALDPSALADRLAR